MRRGRRGRGLGLRYHCAVVEVGNFAFLPSLLQPRPFVPPNLHCACAHILQNADVDGILQLSTAPPYHVAIFPVGKFRNYITRMFPMFLKVQLGEHAESQR